MVIAATETYAHTHARTHIALLHAGNIQHDTHTFYPILLIGATQCLSLSSRGLHTLVTLSHAAYQRLGVMAQLTRLWL